MWESWTEYMYSTVQVLGGGHGMPCCGHGHGRNWPGQALGREPVGKRLMSQLRAFERIWVGALTLKLSIEGFVGGRLLRHTRQHGIFRQKLCRVVPNGATVARLACPFQSHLFDLMCSCTWCQAGRPAGALQIRSPPSETWLQIFK